MLELGGSKAPAADLIKEGSDATFMQDVVEASKTTPVIVDFWTPWCGPCKTLGPALEAAVTKARGAVKMVKIDVDQNQVYAGQLQVQSIPTVYAFFNGQPVDGFQGAVPPSQIDAFVAKLAKMSGESADGGLSEAVEVAEQMIEDGQAQDAADTFVAILQEDGANVAAYAGLIRAHLALGDVDRAEAILNAAPKEFDNAPELDAARAQVMLARQSESAGPIAELKAVVDADPANLQARFDYAVALHAAGQTADAVNELLEIFRKDKEWNEGAAKTQLFQIFDALKPNDPIVLNGRRKLSSMIFA